MTFDESIVIDAPAPVLFDLSQDYKRRLEWDPFLRSARLVDGADKPGVGVRPCAWTETARRWRRSTCRLTRRGQSP